MVQNDLDSHGLSWTDAVDLAQNRPLWRLLATSGATHVVVVQAGEEEEERLIYTWYSASSWNTTSEVLIYGMCFQGISQFYLHTDMFIRSRNEPYLPVPSQL